MILELMGRYAGWIALHAGIAGDADVILLPEIPFDMQEVVDAVLRRNRRGKDFSIIVAAEGAREIDGSYIHTRRGQAKEGEYAKERLGGLGDYLAQSIHEATGMECRATVLGHIQRGGTPVAYDRVLATQFGVMAAEMIARGEFNCVATLQGTKIVSRPIKDLIHKTKNVDPEGQTVLFAESMGIVFGRPNRQVKH